MVAGRLIAALAGLALGTALAFAAPTAWQVGRCRHVHRTSGVTASFLVAEHPRGVTALVEICNATGAPVRVSPRSLPGGGPFLDWDGEARPPYRGRTAAGGGPSLAPGETLAFRVELAELYGLRRKEFYQCRYVAETDAATARSGWVGFYLRLTD